jgi:hypothetical protein
MGDSMRVIGTLSRVSRLIAAIAAVWLWFAGPASAGGGGGADLPGLLGALATTCQFFGTLCPLPSDTATPVVLEEAAITASPPDTVRIDFSLCVDDNLNFIPCPHVAVNAVNAPVKSSPAGSTAGLSYLTPLAFKTGAVPTQYGDPAAQTFFYAVALEGKDGQPQTLDLFYDYTPWANKQFTKGQVANLTFPLVLKSSTGEQTFQATLTLTATCNGAASCLTGTVTGIPGQGMKSFSAAQLGIQFNYDFGPSPNSPTSHAIFEMLLPVLATAPPNPAKCAMAINNGMIPDLADCGNDPAYFYTGPDFEMEAPDSACINGANPASGYCNIFSTGEPGFAASVLGSGKSVGVGPSAVPYPHTFVCVVFNANGTCANAPPALPFTATFFGSPNPAVSDFLVIDTTGKTLVSAHRP